MATKYGNKKIIAHDRKWDSDLELALYDHLLQLHKPNEIILQPKFILQPEFIKHGFKRQPVAYIADFQVGSVVYDAKGFADAQFRIKRKMFDYVYPELQLCVLCKCPVKWQHTYGKWIDLDDLTKERAKIKRDKTKKDKNNDIKTQTNN